MSEYLEQTFGELTVRIDRAQCIGSGNCVKVAPEVFELDDTGEVAFREDAASGDRDRLVEACEVCPVDALIVLTAEGKQIVPEG